MTAKSQSHSDGLDPHQGDAVPWLIERPKAMLAWEMGCGKTAPLVRAWEITAQGGPLLVLCLASARENWRREVIKYALDREWPPKVQTVIDGRVPLDPSADVVICNYDKMLNRQVIFRLRNERRWGAIILDEAHALKTSTAERTKLIYGGFEPRHANGRVPLVACSDRIWLATGTPMPNDPSELYTHAATLWPERMQYNGHTMAEWEFQAAFCDIKETKYGLKIVGAKNLAELRERLLPVVSVLKRKDVLNLPPLTITSWPLDGDNIRGPIPDLPDLLGTLAERYGAPDKIDTFDAATLDAYISCINGAASQVATVRRETSVLKAVLVGLMVTEELDCGSPKTIIYAFHREAISTLEKLLTAHKPAVIHGDVPAGKRQAEIDRFQNEPDCRVFIGQITAAGSSINLQAGSNVIFVEASWCPGDNDQALSRAYRRGQLNPVHVRFAFIGGTIDEAVARALARKAAMVASVF